MHRHLSDRRTKSRRLIPAVLSILALASLCAGCENSDDYPDNHIGVIDGDTVKFEGKLYQIFGIDAPELGQRCLDRSHLYKCGEEAASKLHKVIVLTKADCAPEEGHPDELVCKTAYGPLATVLLRDGDVVVRPDAPDTYISDEEHAKNATLGVWRGDFITPEDWRAGKRLQQEEENPEPCPILGIKSNGAKRYVVPTDADYADVERTPEDIQERFCSDDEARAAGWRWMPPPPDKKND